MTDFNPFANDSVTDSVNMFEILTSQFLAHLQSRNHHEQIVNQDPPTIKSSSRRPSTSPVLNIIIPVSGRAQHLAVTLASLNASLDTLPEGVKELVTITIAELDTTPQHEEIANEHADYYMFIKSEQFNKSHLMNTAASIFQAEVFMFHDVDLIVEKPFLQGLLGYIQKMFEHSGSSWVFQPIFERKIFYVPESVTEKIFSGEIPIEALRASEYEDKLSIPNAWFQNNYPPGGSIVVTRELFHTVQGYDAALFWGYSPEDKTFLANCCYVSNAFHVPSSTEIGRMYHLYHPISEKNNTMYEHMVLIDKMLEISDCMRTTYLFNKHVRNIWDHQNEFVVTMPGHITEFFASISGYLKDNPSGKLTEEDEMWLNNLSTCKRTLFYRILAHYQISSTKTTAGVHKAHLVLKRDVMIPQVRESYDEQELLDQAKQKLEPNPPTADTTKKITGLNFFQEK